MDRSDSSSAIRPSDWMPSSFESRMTMRCIVAKKRSPHKRGEPDRFFQTLSAAVGHGIAFSGNEGDSPMANAEIVAIGSELLLGQIVDTNSAWMAQRLTALGVNLYFKSVV